MQAEIQLKFNEVEYALKILKKHIDWENSIKELNRFNLLVEDDVKKMFKEFKPNIVIHLAALVGGVHHNIEEPVRYFEENILMNTFVLKESYKQKVDKFTGILSSCIYPDKITSINGIAEMNTYTKLEKVLISKKLLKND